MNLSSFDRLYLFLDVKVGVQTACKVRNFGDVSPLDMLIAALGFRVLVLPNSYTEFVVLTLLDSLLLANAIS